MEFAPRQAYADKLRPLLLKDHRFVHVRLEPYTGSGGSLIVIGMVDNDADKEVLRKWIMASNPPVEVSFKELLKTQLQKTNDVEGAPTNDLH